ncbi:MAG: DUF6782 family putative metallopeptidase [Alphaproteobacteria bacterium]
MKNAWNKAARKMKKGALGLTAAAAMAFGAAGCATQSYASESPVAAPTPVVLTQPQVTPPVAPKLAAPTMTAQEQARLDTLLTKMRKVELGREVLDYATAQGITITMSNSKEMDDDLTDGIIIRGTFSGKTITLNADEKNDEELMLTLAHEVRHSWHKNTLHTNQLHTPPKKEWLMDRIQEADCFSFEIHFGYEYEKAVGKKINLGSRANACNNPYGYTCMMENYTANRDSGMSTADAYGKLLNKAFLRVHSLEYDDDFLGDQEKRWKLVIDKPVVGVLYHERWDKPVTDAEFIEAMKKATTPALKTEGNTSGLYKWQDVDFNSLEKTGGTDTTLQKRLDKVEADFILAGKAWEKHWAETLEKNRIKLQTPVAPDTTAPVITPPPVVIPPRIQPPGI